MPIKETIMNRVDRFTKSTKKYLTSQKKEYEAPKDVFVVECTFGSKSGVEEYLVIGKVSTVIAMRDVDDVFMSKVYYGWDSETGAVSTDKLDWSNSKGRVGYLWTVSNGSLYYSTEEKISKFLNQMKYDLVKLAFTESSQ